MPSTPKFERYLLDNYSDILVNFALNGGKGVKKNEVVVLQVPESAKLLLISLYQTVLKSGAHPIIQYLPDELERSFFELAKDEQLTFFPAKLLKGRLAQADHFISIIAETNKHELEGIDPKKIMQRSSSFRPYFEWREKKELAKKFTWTLGLFPTQAMAKEANMSLASCWKQIIKACYLDTPKPVEKWQKVQKEIFRIKKNLNNLPINQLRIESYKTDLIIGVDKNRKWLGGDGRNIPSFEVFISPDWRKTEGHIFFDLPLYRYGNMIDDISLEFHQGKITKLTAKRGESVLREMINTKNADKIGEFSLTDNRLSKINKFMAETLYDENYGGKFGNTHIALGNAYKESFPSKASHLKPVDWENIGYNESVVHTDIISTKDRLVTAIMDDGSKKVIYSKGHFRI